MEKSSSTRPLKKPVARNISESLGKLPPQAIDVEEQIIGNILVATEYYLKVKDILLPEHFYLETHQVIYKAFQESYAISEKITLVSTAHTLRKAGHLELVGGATYLAELSSRAATQGNIEYDARIIIELYVKREIILIASSLHAESYDGFSDPILLFKDAEAKLKELEERAFKSTGPNRIQQLWKDTQITEEPQEHPPIVHIQNIPVCWPDGHTLIVGKKKSRKTLFIVQMVSWFLENKSTTGNEVLIFDTEQSKRHVYKIREKILKMTGKTVAVFFLKGKNPDEIKDFITETVKHWPTPPQLIVNDGIKDMMFDINDPIESTQTVVWMQKLMGLRPGQVLPPHVFNVLHLNKSDSNPRGHIGTELLNKAECTIELELDEQAGCTNVKCESSREKAFEPFSFTHDAESLPTLVLNSNHEAQTPDESKTRLVAAFDGEMLKYGQLTNSIKNHFGCGTSKAKHLVTKFVRDGWILKSGSEHSSDTVYKCMISSTNGVMRSVNETPVHKAPKQKEPELFDKKPAPEEFPDDLPF
jgi:hypothetical protein